MSLAKEEKEKEVAETVDVISHGACGRVGGSGQGEGRPAPTHLQAVLHPVEPSVSYYLLFGSSQNLGGTAVIYEN